MKKLIVLMLLLVAAGCESSGPAGPVGPPGPAGPVGQAFEVEADFNSSNDYMQIFDFPGEVEVLQSDIVVVYLLWEVDSDTGNDVWQQLPVSIFFSNGEMQYAFDHTVADVKLFLTGDVDLSTVGPAYTQDQIFRVAILPVDYVQDNDIDLGNIDEVMSAVGGPKAVKRVVLQ